MATGKGTGGPKSKGGMDWGSGVRSDMVQRPPNPNPSEPHIPYSLLVTVLVLCLVLVIVLPVMGVMYMDMNNAMWEAKYQIQKMKELRLKVLKELKDVDQRPPTKDVGEE